MSDRKPVSRRQAIKLILTVAGATVAFYAVYLLCVRNGHMWVIHVYAAMLFAFGLGAGILTRGFSRAASEEQTEAEAARRRFGKALLVPAVAILFTFMFELIYLNIFIPLIGG